MYEVEPEIRAIQEDIFLRKVARARKTPISGKLADGAILFDQGVRVMRGAIRSLHPNFTDGQVEDEADRRLKIAKQLSERGIYCDAGRSMYSLEAFALT